MKNLFVPLTLALILLPACCGKKKVTDCSTCTIVTTEKVIEPEETGVVTVTESVNDFLPEDKAETDSGPISNPSEDDENLKEIILDDEEDIAK